MSCIHCDTLRESHTAKVLGPVFGKTPEEIDNFIKEIHVYNGHSDRDAVQAEPAALVVAVSEVAAHAAAPDSPEYKAALANLESLEV